MVLGPSLLPPQTMVLGLSLLPPQTMVLGLNPRRLQLQRIRLETAPRLEAEAEADCLFWRLFPRIPRWTT